MVPMTPNGTETRNTQRQPTGPSTPPRTRPMKLPAMPATWLRPSARPRWSAGKASVRIALELAKSIAPPMPWMIRMMIRYQPAAVPWNQVTDSRIENAEKIAKPMLNMRTRPNMSPRRPKLTTSTAVTTMNPIISHSKRVVLPGCSGLMPMPRKISGIAISTMDELMVTISTPSVVLDRAIHL